MAGSERYSRKTATLHMVIDNGRTINFSAASAVRPRS